MKMPEDESFKDLNDHLENASLGMAMEYLANLYRGLEGAGLPKPDAALIVASLFMASAPGVDPNSEG